MRHAVICRAPGHEEEPSVLDRAQQKARVGHQGGGIRGDALKTVLDRDLDRGGHRIAAAVRVHDHARVGQHHHGVRGLHLARHDARIGVEAREDDAAPGAVHARHLERAPDHGLEDVHGHPEERDLDLHVEGEILGRALEELLEGAGLVVRDALRLPVGTRVPPELPALLEPRPQGIEVGQGDVCDAHGALPTLGVRGEDTVEELVVEDDRNAVGGDLYVEFGAVRAGCGCHIDSSDGVLADASGEDMVGAHAAVPQHGDAGGLLLVDGHNGGENPPVEVHAVRGRD
mmetsp:Transcript_65904/g.208576  ORF Transcript_65904/g.208576 Transcript_65904/m.208576 type:complete len:287 (-) Transcript_65904:262-1122(-)